MEVYCEYKEMVNPETLVDHPRNPNTHPQKQIDVLAESIKTYGWRHPIVVSKLSNKIISGHCRKYAAQKLKCDAPIDYQDFKSEDEELAVLLADNLIPELAEIDKSLMKIGLDILSSSGKELTSVGIIEDICETDIPEIDIADKEILERLVIFVESSIKKEISEKIKKITSEYDETLVRFVK